MTGKSAFTEEEWQAILEAPATAGLMVLTADQGGTFRETFAMASAYTEARQRHGASELLDEIVAARPEFPRDRFGSLEALQAGGPQLLGQAVAALEAKATPQDVDDYRAFVLGLARRVAEAHKEQGQSISEGERAALDRIALSVGGQGAQP